MSSFILELINFAGYLKKQRTSCLEKDSNVHHSSLHSYYQLPNSTNSSVYYNEHPIYSCSAEETRKCNIDFNTAKNNVGFCKKEPSSTSNTIHQNSLNPCAFTDNSMFTTFNVSSCLLHPHQARGTEDPSKVTYSNAMRRTNRRFQSMVSETASYQSTGNHVYNAFPPNFNNVECSTLELQTPKLQQDLPHNGILKSNSIPTAASNFFDKRGQILSMNAGYENSESSIDRNATYEFSYFLDSPFLISEPHDTNGCIDESQTFSNASQFSECRLNIFPQTENGDDCFYQDIANQDQFCFVPNMCHHSNNISKTEIPVLSGTVFDNNENSRCFQYENQLNNSCSYNYFNNCYLPEDFSQFTCSVRDDVMSSSWPTTEEPRYISIETTLDDMTAGYMTNPNQHEAINMNETKCVEQQFQQNTSITAQSYSVGKQTQPDEFYPPLTMMHPQFSLETPLCFSKYLELQHCNNNSCYSSPPTFQIQPQTENLESNQWTSLIPEEKSYRQCENLKNTETCLNANFSNENNEIYYEGKFENTIKEIDPRKTQKNRDQYDNCFSLPFTLQEMKEKQVAASCEPSFASTLKDKEDKNIFQSDVKMKEKGNVQNEVFYCTRKNENASECSDKVPQIMLMVENKNAKQKNKISGKNFPEKTCNPTNASQSKSDQQCRTMSDKVNNAKDIQEEKNVKKSESQKFFNDNERLLTIDKSELCSNHNYYCYEQSLDYSSDSDGSHQALSPSILSCCSQTTLKASTEICSSSQLYEAHCSSIGHEFDPVPNKTESYSKISEGNPFNDRGDKNPSIDKITLTNNSVPTQFSWYDEFVICEETESHKTVAIQVETKYKKAKKDKISVSSQTNHMSVQAIHHKTFNERNVQAVERITFVDEKNIPLYRHLSRTNF